MNIRRLLGFLFLIAAAAGIIFSIVSLIQIWRYEEVVTQNVVDNLALVDQALDATQDGLTVVDQVVETTKVDVTSLQTTTRALALAIHDTNSMLTSLSTMASKDFPDSVKATQTSLASAESSALLIDNTLAVITSIPFLPLSAYKPQVPLHTALAEVSTSLDSIPTSLATIHTSLDNGKVNLEVVEVELDNISETTKEISSALGSAQTAIGHYQTVTKQVKARVEALQLVAPGWIKTVTWVLSFVLVWVLISQLGLGLQGLDILQAHRKQARRKQAHRKVK
jgi:hypothetical protein